MQTLAREIIMLNDYMHTQHLYKSRVHANACMHMYMPPSRTTISIVKVPTSRVSGKAFSGYRFVPSQSTVSMIMGMKLRKGLVWVSIKTFTDISNWPSELTGERRLQ